MWASFSLLLVILMLALSLRFYWSHLHSPSGPSPKASWHALNVQKRGSKNLKVINSGMKPVSPSSKHDSKLLKITTFNGWMH